MVFKVVAAEVYSLHQNILITAHLRCKGGGVREGGGEGGREGGRGRGREGEREEEEQEGEREREGEEQEGEREREREEEEGEGERKGEAVKCIVHLLCYVYKSLGKIIYTHFTRLQ